jgi:hypothetical protein
MVNSPDKFTKVENLELKTTYTLFIKTIKAVLSFLKKEDMTVLPTSYEEVQKRLQYNIFSLHESTVTVNIKETPLKTKNTS